MNHSGPPIEVEQKPHGISVVRFTRPQERNPLSSETLAALHVTLSQLSSAETKAIIITGTEDVFASGADIRELEKLDVHSARKFSRQGQDLFHLLSVARQITIAAINGYCLGGALDLALACHIRVAAKNAVFAHPGARLGIITGWGGTQRLPRLIGQTRALELFATARRIDSHEALRIGLVSQVCDPALSCALKVAREAIAATV